MMGGYEAMQPAPTALADWVLILPVVLTLAGSGLLLTVRTVRWLHAPVTMLIIGAVAASDLLLVLRVLDAGPIAMTMGNWLPPFGITFAADAMSAVFALLAALLTFFVLVYHL